MIYASVCDGIGAVHCAWQPLGWRCAWTSEIERFPIAVVEQRWGFTNLGDMTKITETQLEQYGPIDVLVGGTPCQSFSVAGLRKGLADPRGNLALEFLRIADAARPRWVVWENVPGVRSSSGGRDIGAFLGALGQLGYGWAYRSLDAQYFGLAQRRERVFVVGYFGDWRRAAAVLFERESLSGNTPPGRGEGKDVAGTIAARTRGGGGHGTDFECDGGLVAFDTTQITSKGNYSNPKPGDPCHPLAASAHPPVVAYRTSGNNGVMLQGDRTAALNCNTDQTQQIIQLRHGVRRLTPLEYERLQGFPDGYTAITYRKKPAKDGPRYKAIGNSMAVPCMRWIGERIGINHK